MLLWCSEQTAKHTNNNTETCRDCPQPQQQPKQHFQIMQHEIYTSSAQGFTTYADSHRRGKWMRRLLTKKSFRNSAVSVWNGAWLEGVTDGSKRGYGCGLDYKLNVVSDRGSRRNTLKAPRDDSIVLITEYVGFRFAYLRQMWTRMTRASVSAEARADTVMMVHPSAMIGTAKHNYWRTSESQRCERVRPHLVPCSFCSSQAGQQGVQLRRVRPRAR